MRFWEWFAYAYSDRGQVQISVFDEGAWSAWTALKTVNRHTPTWHHARLDLTVYAGKPVRIGFYHEDKTEDTGSTPHHYERTGWYIDDVSIIVQEIPVLSDIEDFELDVSDWFSDRGIWQIGTPSSGPGGAYSGTNCIGTVLGGNYPWDGAYEKDGYGMQNDGPYSTLLSPIIDLPNTSNGQELILRFWQFYSYASADKGEVWVQIYDFETREWSWAANPEMVVNSYVVDWFHAFVDLTSYSGKRIRIGFYHVDNTEDTGSTPHHYESSGWYIDDVEIQIQ